MANELVFETPEAAFETARQMLTEGHYVVLLSREERFWVLNYEYSDLNDRNDVVFIGRDEFDDKYVEYAEVKWKEAEG